MKLWKISSLIVFLAFSMIFLGGCNKFYVGISTEPDTVKVLTPEDIDSIFAEVSCEIIDKYPVETDAEGNQIVFWLDGGTVWHLSLNCSSIKKADPSNVSNGSVSDAVSSGKKRPCKVCGGESEYTEILIYDTTSTQLDDTVSLTATDKYPKEFDENGELIVYWLEGGKVWHVSTSCQSLSRSDPDKLSEGSISDAVAAGKERACKNCAE